MARVKRAVNAQKKRRTVLESASGYRGQRSRLYRKAKEQMLHSMQYAYRDRRDRKGDFRQLWITRINAARPRQRHDLQPPDPGPAPGRRRGRPQDPGRPRGQRRDRVRRASSRSPGRPSPPRARRRRPAPSRLTLERAHAHAGDPGRTPLFTARTPRVVAARRAAAPPRPRRDRPVPRRGPAGGPRGAGRRRGRRAVRHRRRAATATPTWPTRPRAGVPVAGDRRRRSPRWPRPSPRRAWSPSASTSTCRWPSARRRARGWSRCSPRSATRATPARCCAPPTRPAPARWSSPATPSTRTTASACGPRAGSLFHVDVVRGGDPPAAVAALRARRAAGARRRPATATTDLDDLADAGGLRRPTAWLFGSEAHGLPGELADAGRRRGSGCRSTAGPRA